MAVKISSPLSTAANNIVSLGNSSKGSFTKVQTEFQSFTSFLEIRKNEIENIELPSKRKIRELGNINIVNNFGSVGNLLSNLFTGALDIGSFLSGFFPGKGEKIGKQPTGSKPQPKPKLQGGKLRLGGLRALGIVNAVFSGLDFATGLSEGESVGKAGSGAIGSLVGGFGGAIAGSLLAGAIGQTLVPVPGLGFVLGAALGSAGSFLGGWSADRAYESITGEVKKKQEEKIKTESRPDRTKSSRKIEINQGKSFDEVLSKFSQAVSKFENFVINFPNIMGVDENNPYNEPSEYPDFPETPTDFYDGPVDGDTFFPLPGGDVGTRGNISPGQAFGAPRGGRSHAGLDMTHHKGSLDAPVVAYKTGKVIWASGSGSYNSGLMIDHGNGLKTKYFHITPLVKTGDIVYGGQQIAKLFPAGNSTHLHFEVHRGGSPINPLNAGVGPGGSAIRLPAPLSAENAKNNNVSSNKSGVETKSSGVDLYTKISNQQTNKSKSSLTQKFQLPQPQMMQIPQSVIAAPPKTPPNIESYTSYSKQQTQQTLILEKETIMRSGSQTNSRPVVMSSGGVSKQASTGPGIVAQDPGVSILNSLMKGILLTSLSSS